MITKRNLFTLLVITWAVMITAFTITDKATNFERLVLGSANYSTDPNPTADISLQNDEYITNATNGTIGFGAANLVTTGTATFTNLGASTLTGALTATDTTTAPILIDTSGVYWILKVAADGTVSSDSTGLN